MPLPVSDIGPLQQALAQRKENFDLMFQGLETGARLGSLRTQAKLQMQSLALQEQQLNISRGNQQIAQAELQQRHEALQFQQQKWDMESRELQNKLHQFDSEAPLRAAEMASRVAIANQTLKAQSTFAEFGGWAADAIAEDERSRMSAVSRGEPPVPSPALQELFRLYPDLLVHPTIQAALKTADGRVKEFEESWLTRFGRSSAGTQGSTISQDFFTWQRLQATDPELAKQYRQDVLDNRYKSEDPATQIALLRLKAVYADPAADATEKKAAEQAFINASSSAKAARSTGLPTASGAPTIDYQDFLNMDSQGLLQ